MDIVNTETRRRMMAGIRAKDTKPELTVRRALHARGLRYRLHPAGVLGKPDLAFPRHRALIFVHGCFWHGHNCRYFKIPKTRTDFWIEKISQNQHRDARVMDELQRDGWRILIIWECSVRAFVRSPANPLIDNVIEWLLNSQTSMQINEEGEPVPCTNSQLARSLRAQLPNT